MLFYERAESLEPVPPTASFGPRSLDISSSSDPVVHYTDQKSQQVAPAQSQQAPTDAETDELMPPASPQAMQEPPAASATSPNVLAQLANVSPLKVQGFYCS